VKAKAPRLLLEFMPGALRNASTGMAAWATPLVEEVLACQLRSMMLRCRHCVALRCLTLPLISRLHCPETRCLNYWSVMQLLVGVVCVAGRIGFGLGVTV
jgi:hypothetical protein